MSDRELVVLLHGLGRTQRAMLPLARFLAGAGWEVVNVGYRGGRAPLTASADWLASELATRLEALPPGPVHFVTHSLGGILARALLGRGQPIAGRAPGRLVQLAPPNQGARIAGWVRRLPPARLLAGPALDDLAARDEPGLPLPPLSGIEVGVIAGGRGGPRGYVPWFPDDSDGIVRVVETYLPEARDWILLPRIHTFIMRSQDTQQNVAAFLRTGRFLPDAPRLGLAPDGTPRLLLPVEP